MNQESQNETIKSIDWARAQRQKFKSSALQRWLPTLHSPAKWRNSFATIPLRRSLPLPPSPPIKIKNKKQNQNKTEIENKIQSKSRIANKSKSKTQIKPSIPIQIPIQTTNQNPLPLPQSLSLLPSSKEHPVETTQIPIGMSNPPSKIMPERCSSALQAKTERLGTRCCPL